MIKRIFLSVQLLIGFSAQINGAPTLYTYKNIDGIDLKLQVFNPEKINPQDSCPAVLFFFGGGWQSGTPQQFVHQAKYFASRGIVAILVDYRIESKDGVKPNECVKDAKAAIRYVRKNAMKLGVDPNKIIASGGSAGGHLAAATALCKEFDHADDDLSIDGKPNALVLFNPVIDNSKEGYGYERVAEFFPAISPLHNITKGAPPTLFLLGSKDNIVSVSTAQKFEQKMKDTGSYCKVIIYEGESHGFFNYKKDNPHNYCRTLYDADVFLESLGYLKGKPTIYSYCFCSSSLASSSK
ncbi:MAG: alpha/beta hydrolase [Dysgonamonadaceae bacterium]|jgi:acetyl esterase/lipase|nr:alpha/beta hydrolase [Dysgonamonadaceae bacterium]